MIRRAAALGLGTVLVVLASLGSFAGATAANIDDAFILMVYERHLLARGALDWNAGAGAVDGFTSVLDLLLKSLVVALTGGDIVRTTFWVTLVMHVAVGLLAMALTFFLLRERRPAIRVAGAALGGLLLGATPALADGASYLLETPLYVTLGLALVGAVVVFDRWSPPRLAGMAALAFLAFLARPEGLALGGWALLAATVQSGRRAAAMAWAAFLALVAAYFAWHWHHFGYVAPNTYYAKTSASRWNEVRDGWHYLATYLGEQPGLLAAAALLAGVVALAMRGWAPERRLRQLFLVLAALGATAEIVYAGGDCYGGGRFLALPAVLAAASLAHAAIFAPTRARQVALALVALLAVIELGQALNHPLARLSFARAQWPMTLEQFSCELPLAQRLRQASAGGAVAQTDFQRLKYFDDALQVIDLHGLSDMAIAHQPVTEPVVWGKFDPATVVERRPEVWIWGNMFLGSEPISAYPMRRLLDDDGLQERFAGYAGRERARGATADAIATTYLPASTRLCDGYFNLLVRSDVAARYAAAGFTVGGP
ncbi:MAG: hypothetical protein JST54_14465 [Deltaproteobacteria bacterium]|nr:hypothetical protein [Deltaproteobacteria bacterium]